MVRRRWRASSGFGAGGRCEAERHSYAPVHISGRCVRPSCLRYKHLLRRLRNSDPCPESQARRGFPPFLGQLSINTRHRQESPHAAGFVTNESGGYWVAALPALMRASVGSA